MRPHAKCGIIVVISEMLLRDGAHPKGLVDLRTIAKQITHYVPRPNLLGSCAFIKDIIY